MSHPCCCAALRALLHDLAAPACALETVHRLAPWAGAEAAELGALMGDALARLRFLWQQGQGVLASGADAEARCPSLQTGGAPSRPMCPP